MMDSRVIFLSMLEIVLAIKFSSTAMYNIMYSCCVLDHRIDSSTVYLLFSLLVVSGDNGGNSSPEPMLIWFSSPAIIYMSNRVGDTTIACIRNLLLI